MSANTKFDIQLATAIVRENALARLFSDADLTIEHKGETYLWRRSGKICIEYGYRDLPSGIAATEADLWVHELYDDDGQLIVRLVFEMETLKELCRAAKSRGQRLRHVGDDKLASIILLSLWDIIGKSR